MTEVEFAGTKVLLGDIAAKISGLDLDGFIEVAEKVGAAGPPSVGLEMLIGIAKAGRPLRDEAQRQLGEYKRQQTAASALIRPVR